MQANQLGSAHTAHGNSHALHGNGDAVHGLGAVISFVDLYTLTNAVLKGTSCAQLASAVLHGQLGVLTLLFPAALLNALGFACMTHLHTQ